jgi:hypothetical protein
MARCLRSARDLTDPANPPFGPDANDTMRARL